MNRYFQRLWRQLSSGKHESVVVEKAAEYPRTLPVIWLLGKTGAGKSSLVRALTGLEAVTVGNGFEPCTRTAAFFDYPEENPMIRFLDTRGLGEAGYDPGEDLAQCEKASHVLLAVARLDDPVQGALVEAVKAVRNRAAATPVIAVYTGADLVPGESERNRARSAIQARLEELAGASPPWLEVAIPPEHMPQPESGIGDLVALLDEILPEVALLLVSEEFTSAEKAAFARCRADVVRYAGVAGATDIAPVVGAFTVPSVQAAMLHRLGRHYGVEWTRTRMGEFSVALGIGIAGRFGAAYAIRQVAKLIPVYGQTAGAAAAGTISFASTYALGRAAAYYLYRKQKGEKVSAQEIRELYRGALTRARHSGRHAGD